MFVLAAAMAMAAPVPTVHHWVTVKGTVLWPEREKIPERKEIEPITDKEYAGKGGPITDDTFVIDAKSYGMKNVVVWLRPDDDDPEAVILEEKIHPTLREAKPVTHAITGEFCRYDRRVSAARAGDTLEVTYKSKVAMQFDYDDGVLSYGRTVPQGNPHRFTDLRATKVPGLFRDSIFPHARGYVRVFDHPYFAVTNERGEFEMKQVPRGKWRLVFWHESGFHKGKDGRFGFPIEVTGNKDAEMQMKPLAFEVPKASGGR